MNSGHEIAQEVLLQNKYSTVGMEEIKQLLVTSNNNSYCRISTSYRLCRTLRDVRKKEGWVDFCSALRQAILFNNKNFHISEYIYNHIKDIGYKFKLLFNVNKTSTCIEVSALKDYPKWFDEDNGLDALYSLESVKNSRSPVGDPLLYNMTGFRKYKSNTQKTLISASMNMSNGTTLLGCMPTGEGKSLVGLMPQFYSDHGTTIIIVPTVSLAIDQSKNARKLYKNKKYEPEAYHSGLDYNEKQALIQKIKEGKLPILFISPEALLNSRFNSLILECAREGKINTLVVDEAHIVQDWGDQFRTEFQFLSVYRRKLLKVSDYKLKTILLSATFTRECVELLKKLFSEGDNYIEIRGDALRPEINYYIDVSKTKSDRLVKLKELIYLLPRPMIIYLIKPDDAEALANEIRGLGFNSIGVFTGKISKRSDREKLLEDWNNNLVDIMIATSAFGMGVDKKDVRTVVHFCIPESVNRFYQEVGRGGRDGKPSLSILLTMPSEDMKDTLHLTNGKILTVDTFIPRWQAMKENIVERLDGNTILVDSSIKPEYMTEDRITGRQNASWNEHVILQLYKFGYIDILDFEINDRDYKNILIRIKNPIVDNLEGLSIEIEEKRKIEINKNRLSVSDMKSLATNKRSEECLANSFKNIYGLASRSCGGCIYCRENQNQTYWSRNFTEYIRGEEIIRNSLIFKSNNHHSSHFDMKDNLILTYKEMDIDEVLINHIFKELQTIHLNTLIIPNEMIYENIKYEVLGISTESFFNIYTVEELKDEYIDIILEGTIAILYDDKANKKNNSELFKLANELYKKGSKIIHVLDCNLELENGIPIVDNINGIIKDIEFEGVVGVGL